MIERAHRPVIVLPAGCGPDGYATAAALVSVWKRANKTIDVVAADGAMPSTLSFLKTDLRIRSIFGALRKFVVDVDVQQTPLAELSYDVKDGNLSIYLTPKHGVWNASDVTTRTGAYKYDLIIALGAHDLEAFGDLFLRQTDFFHTTPVLNIDHTPSNEHFGQVNIVDVTATSVGEVVLVLLESLSHEHITEEIATLLLTGMIAKTQSFKAPSVKPQTLARAGELVSRGARREDIVHNLFRTRSVETLRLWGRVLARLKKDAATKLVWSVLTQQDFAVAGADEETLADVIDDLIFNAPEARVVVLLYEDKERHVCGIISGGVGIDSLQLAMPFKPVGTHAQARICFTDLSLAKAEQRVIESVKERIARATS